MSRLVFLSLLLLPGLAAAQNGGPQQLTFVGVADPRTQDYADLWGYAAPDGREFAVVNARVGGGLSVMTVPEGNPVEVTFIPGPRPSNGSGSDVEMYGHYAYVSDDRADVMVVSLADPDHPVLVNTFQADPGATNEGVHTLTVADGYLYTQGGLAPGGVRIWSLADPVHPAYVGQYQPHYVHDILVRGDTLFTAGIYGEGIDIVDISDRANPTLINRFNYPGSGAHNICATTDGSYLFVGDEIGSGTWTRVFDVSDPQNVELVAQIIVDAAAVVHNCHVVGDRLYLGHYTEGARVWDISDPVHPTEVAYYDTTPGGPGGFAGVWSFYPHLPSGRLIATDRAAGLYVLRMPGGVAAEGDADARALALTVAPNPVRGMGRVTFTLPEVAQVRLAVYDVLGREVAVLAEGTQAPGPHEATLDATALPPGLYVARLTAGGRTAITRISVGA